jgi:hypothetical protein
MNPIEAIKLAESLKRDMPRNAKVVALCDELIRLVFGEVVSEPAAKPDSEPKSESIDARKGHNKFMRDYMRKWRGGKAGGRIKKGGTTT